LGSAQVLTGRFRKVLASIDVVQISTLGCFWAGMAKKYGPLFLVVTDLP